MSADKTYDGNDLDEWISTFGFSEKLASVIKEGLEANFVDDLAFVYDDPELLKQVESAVNRLEYKKFLAARQKCSRIAVSNPSTSTTTSTSTTASGIPAPAPRTGLPVAPAAPPAPPAPSAIELEIVRKQQELLEIQKRIQEEKEKQLRAEEKTKSVSKKRRMIADLEERIRRAASLDMVFLLDCTGSMSAYLDNCKNQINDFVTQIRAMHPNISMRLAFIGYRDHCDGVDRLAVLRFTTSVEEFRNTVASQVPKGGGDEAEDVFGGLHVVRGLDWTSETRILYHIGDAPCHGKEYHDSRGSDDYPNGDPNSLKADDILRSLLNSKVIYYFGKINDRTDIMIREFNRIATGTGIPRPAATATSSSGSTGQYITVTPLSGATMMEVITKSVTATFSETLSSSARTEEGKLARKEVILDPSVPDFSSIPVEEALRFQMTMPPSIEVMITNLTETDEDKCISDFPDHDHHFVKCAKLPFAKGEMRAAYYGQAIVGSSSTGVIVKESLALSSSQLTKPKYEAFLSCHRAAKALSLEFNRAKPSDCPRIEFCDACIIQFMSRRGQPFMIQESQISDYFEKYNNNSGYCAPNPTLRGTRHDAIQAFSHWTYHITNQRLMVVDCQGGFNSSLNRFLLTDPAVHFTDVTHFGGTNMGKSGMIKFFETHHCNQHCRALRLTKPSI